MSNSQKGFTLIELMFSVGIMALVLLSSFLVLSEAHNMSVESRSRLLALNAARSTLEAVKSTPLASVGTLNTAQFVPADLPGGAITIATNPANVSGATIATVTVTVNYLGAKNMARTLQISTMRSIY